MSGLLALALVLTGRSLNLLVFIRNRGKMPVRIDDVPQDDLRHTPASGSTHLNWLGDWIPLPFRYLASPGDILFTGGVGFGVLVLLAGIL